MAQIDPIWVKIGDFGISKLVSNDGTALRTSRIGTQGFQAPEVLRLLDNAPETSEYTHAVDMWSLGCVLYVLKCQKLPFPGGSLWGYCQGYGSVPDSPLRSAGMTFAGVQFLNELLAVDPSKRPSAANALQSPWIVQQDGSNDGLNKTGGEPNGSTMDQLPNTMIRNFRKRRNIDFETPQFRSYQKAVKPTVPTDTFSKAADTARIPPQNVDMPEYKGTYGFNFARPDTQSQPSQYETDETDPHPIYNYYRPSVPYGIPQAHDASNWRYPNLESDTYAEFKSAANSLPGPAFRGSGNSASNDRTPFDPVLKPDEPAKPFSFEAYWSGIPFPPALVSMEGTKESGKIEPDRSGIPFPPALVSMETTKDSGKIEPDRSGLLQVPPISRKRSQRTHSEHELDSTRRPNERTLEQDRNFATDLAENWTDEKVRRDPYLWKFKQKQKQKQNLDRDKAIEKSMRARLQSEKMRPDEM